MIGKIAVIDPGSYAVKVVLASISLQKVTWDKQFSLQREEYASEEDLFRNLQGKLAKAGYTEMVLMPAQNLQFRVLELPFSTEKEIRAVLRAELEDVLPNSETGFVHDFQIMSGTTPQSRRILAAALPKHILSQNFSVWQSAGLKPGYVGLESYARAGNFLHAKGGLSPKTTLLLDFGFSKTLLTLLHGHELFYVRALPLGARDFNQIIEEILHIGTRESDHIRILLGELLWSGKIATENLKQQMRELNITSADLKKIQQRSLVAISRVLQDISITLDAQKHSLERIFGTPAQQKPDRVLISGGFSQQPKLKQLLEHTLGQEVWFIASDRLQDIIPRYSYTDTPFFAARGLCYQYAKRSLGFNFLQEEFARFSAVSSSISLRWPLLLISAAMIILAVNLSVRASLKQAEVEHLEEMLRKRIRQSFPGVSIGNDPVRSVRSAIAALQQKNRSQLKTNQSDVRILNLLQKVSQLLQSEKELKIKELRYSQDLLKLEAHTDSYKKIDDVQKKLQTDPMFTSVEVSNTRQALREKGILFQMNIKVK